MKKSSPKKSFFTRAQKKHPYLLALANPHARAHYPITLGTRVSRFCVTSRDNPAFWLVHLYHMIYILVISVCLKALPSVHLAFRFYRTSHFERNRKREIIVIWWRLLKVHTSRFECCVATHGNLPVYTYVLHAFIWRSVIVLNVSFSCFI